MRGAQPFLPFEMFFLFVPFELFLPCVAAKGKARRAFF